MPVSHIGLTVSHLPTSCSFFLSALQPLGYRYIGQHGNQIGLGIADADFFLCQESAGIKAGAAHIAFTATSRASVRDFYAAALNAGGRPNGAPAYRGESEDHFNAAILDFDGNSIEVVFSHSPDMRDDGTVIEHSRVITWQRTVSERYYDDRSVVSARSHRASDKQSTVSTVPKAISVVSQGPSTLRRERASSLVRTVSDPIVTPQVPTTPNNGDGAAKTIIGTLLGAAAGAAVAYAMVRSEQDSAEQEEDFFTFKQASTAIATVARFAQSKADSLAAQQQQQQAIATTEAQDPLAINVTADVRSQASVSRSAQRAIEAPPPSSHHSVVRSTAPTQVDAPMAIEYVPARSNVSAARSHFAANRSVTNPVFPTASQAQHTASRAPSKASSLISSFVPDRPSDRSGEGSIASSHHTSRSKAHTTHSKHSSRAPSRTASPPPPSRAPSSKAASTVILGRDARSTISGDPFADAFAILDLSDNETIAPSDSVSNAGSRRRHRRKSRHGGDATSSAMGSSASKASSRHSHSHSHSHSKISKHSSATSSTHSSSRRRSSQHHKDSPSESASTPPPHTHTDSPDPTASKRRLSTIVSEPSNASTVRPVAASTGKGGRSRTSSSRKDSLLSAEHYGNKGGEMPIRGITASMVDDGVAKKSVMSYSLGQKIRNFEG